MMARSREKFMVQRLHCQFFVISKNSVNPLARIHFLRKMSRLPDGPISQWLTRLATPELLTMIFCIGVHTWIQNPKNHFGVDIVRFQVFNCTHCIEVNLYLKSFSY